jgi:hypothetical protein
MPAGIDMGTAARGGAAIHVLRAYLASCGYRTQWLAPDPVSVSARDATALGTVLVRPR